MKPLFVFDLDSTITKCELLPLIAESVDLGDEMVRLTEAAMQGKTPFEQNFRKRVALLERIPVSTARSIVAGAPQHERIAEFIRENPNRCIILTGNLDVWIAPIIEKLGMKGRCLCSRAEVRENRVSAITSVLDKGIESKKLPHPFVAIGDGSNDVAMLKAADVGIAFGGVRKLSEDVIRGADKVITDECELIAYLRSFL